MTTTPTTTPASPPPAPSIPPLSTPKKFDYSLSISLLALVVAGWAANETRETRLDARRAQLRAEGLGYIQEVRMVVNTVNCYTLVKGAKIEGQAEFTDSLNKKEATMREGIAEISSSGQEALTEFEKSLNKVKGQPQNMLNVFLVTVRNSWDKDLREKADAVCKAS